MTENILGKAENPGYQHFYLFPQSFQKLQGHFRSGLCDKQLTLNPLPHNPDF